jgi:hypothetical protein
MKAASPAVAYVDFLIILILAPALGGVLFAGIPGCQKNEGPNLVADAGSVADMNMTVLTPDDDATDTAVPLIDAQADADTEVSPDANVDQDNPMLDSGRLDADADGGVGVSDAPLTNDAPTDQPMEKAPVNLPTGQGCAAGSWCRSGFCVDGVCCETDCDAADPMRCTGCSQVKTGQRDGVCGADRAREQKTCGSACGQISTDVPAVMAMICAQGSCVVPASPTLLDTCLKPLDKCTSSFCDQATSRSARCVNLLCPTGGTCCCEAPGGDAQRTCVTTTACNNGLICVSL